MSEKHLGISEGGTTSNWLSRLTVGDSGTEQQVIDQYSEQLLALAGRRLPLRMRSRVDPEDILQSVYRSFFRRLKNRTFQLGEPGDLWRLLVAITYFKIANSVKFHHRDRRDVRRETPLPAPDLAGSVTSRAPIGEDVDSLYETLESVLQVLSESSKSIVVRRLQGETMDEIAVNVQRSRRTVMRVLANVRELAAQMLVRSTRTHRA